MAYLSTKFEDPTFIRSGDMTVAPKIKNGSRDPDHAHMSVFSYPIFG